MKRALITFLAGFLVLALSASPALAAGVLPTPQAFWGNVTVNGSPAPAGTVIEARGDNVSTGVDGNPLTTTGAGTYGYGGQPAFNNLKLVVQGDIAEGSSLNFFVNGVATGQTTQFHTGQVTRLDLVANILMLTASTGSALNIGTTTATLNGDLTQMSGAPSALVSFQWGTTTAYSDETPGQTLNAPGPFSATLSGLAPGTTFHYRSKAVAAGTTVFGGDQTFITTSAPAVVQLSASTGKVSGIGTTTAILEGSLTQLNGAVSALVNFQWGISETYGNETPGQTMFAPGDFTAVLNGLAPGTPYHYRSKAVAAGTIVFGGDRTFTTATVPSGGGGGGTSGTGSGSGGGSSGPGNTVNLSRLSGDTELKVDNSGKTQAKVRLSNSGPGKPVLEIPSGTTMKTATGAPLAAISLSTPDVMPAAPPQNAIVVAQDFGPNGATFDPPITLTLTFDPAALPAGIDEKNLVIAFWDGARWITLETTVDAEANTVSARTSHFTIFGILAPAAPATATAIPAPPPSAPGPTQAVTQPSAPPSAPAPETAPAPAAPPAPVTQTNWVLIAGLVIGGVVAIILALILGMRRRTPTGQD